MVDDLADQVSLGDVGVEDSSGAVWSEAKTLVGAYEHDWHLWIEHVDDVAEFQCTLNVTLHIYNDCVKAVESMEFFTSFVDVVDEVNIDSQFRKSL